MNKQDKYISMTELAKLLNVNKSALSYWNSKKLIQPEFVCGKLYVFDKAKTITKLKSLGKLKHIYA